MFLLSQFWPVVFHYTQLTRGSLYFIQYNNLFPCSLAYHCKWGKNFEVSNKHSIDPHINLSATTFRTPWNWILVLHPCMFNAWFLYKEVLKTNKSSGATMCRRMKPLNKYWMKPQVKLDSLNPHWSIVCTFSFWYASKLFSCFSYSAVADCFYLVRRREAYKILESKS